MGLTAKKVLIGGTIVLFIGSLIGVGIIGWLYYKGTEIKKSPENILSPIVRNIEESDIFSRFNTKKYDTSFEIGKPFNILLLGIDRRSKAETAYRTDVMILVSVNPENNRVLLTSVPRDLWVLGGRVNALYIQSGWEGIQNAFYEITGLKPDKFILTDFEDFSWIVDAMGGVTANVERSFVDSEYPVDATKTYQTISFNTGAEKLTGSRALIFARSRHGTNGEGSDWMRMRRQHLILKGMAEAVLQPESIFNPMVVEKAFETVTNGRMDTNLSLGDAKYLWDYYKDKDKYTIESLFMDSEHVYNPPMSDYGGAWVLVPINNNYTNFRNTVNAKLFGPKEEIPANPEPVPTI